MQTPGTGTEASTLIQTKLNRPRLRGDLVHRSHLMERLACGAEHKLTLISAPAGYGKTTLLAQWLEACPYPSAWLSLDAGDSDLGRFVSYTTAAIRTVYRESCASARELMRAPQPPPVGHLVSVLVNELAALPDSLILALDDYHTIREPAVHQLLAQLIQYLPDRVHLAVASRTDPPLALDRLRASREMLELRAHDLRFSRDEAQSYLDLELEQKVDPRTSALLDRRTEGWVAGLHLAALWLRSTEDHAAILDGLQDDPPRFVTDYLATEVLARQPAEVQGFLLRTCVLDRFCAALCDEVLDIGDWRSEAENLPASGDHVPSSSQAMLERLERDGLFLVALDETHEWYRYHHLFQKMLQQRLHTLAGPHDVANLHLRASGWLAASGRVEEALQHALAAGDVDAAARLVEQNCHNLLNRLERPTLERWLAMLPQDVIWQRPRLLVARAWLLYRQGRLAALDAILDRAGACLGNCDGKLPVGDERSTWGHVHALRSGTAFLLQEDFQRSLASAERALEWLPVEERGARGTAQGYWCLAQQALGDNEIAVNLLEKALAQYSPTQPAPARAQTFIGLCFLHYRAGDLVRMFQTLDRYLVFAAQANQANATVGASWLSGLLHYEWNDLDAAMVHFTNAFELRHRSQFMAAFNSQLGLAQIYQIRGDLDQAWQTLADLRAETLRLDNTESLPPLDALQAQQWVLQGYLDRAMNWARSHDPESRGGSAFWSVVPSLVQTRILVSAGTDREVRARVRGLEERLTHVETQHFTQRAIQILAHLALAYDRLGQVQDALEALERAVTLAQPGGFIRSFVDPGPRLKPLLHQLSRRGASASYVQRVLDAFNSGVSGLAHDRLGMADAGLKSTSQHPQPVLSKASGPQAVAPLTRRETEILRYVQAGWTNPEIADELVISLYTVKRHASNIYNKLGVRGRRKAVREAERLGILPARQTGQAAL